MKTYKITDKEVVNQELQELGIGKSFHTLKDMSDTFEIIKGLVLEIRTIRKIKSNDDLKNIYTTIGKIKERINYYFDEKNYHNRLYDLFHDTEEDKKKFYRIVVMKNENKTTKFIYLAIIEIKDLKNGLYKIEIYDDFKKNNTGYYNSSNQEILDKVFTYEELVKFLANNEYQAYKEEKIESIKNELIFKIKELGFQEYEILPFEVKDLSSLEEDIYNFKKNNS